MAAARDDLALRVTGLFYRAHAYLTTGEHQKVLKDCHDLFEAVAGREHERFGLSGLPYTGAAQMAAWSLVELDDEAGAFAVLDRGEAVAEAADHLYSLAVIRGARTLVLALYGRPEEAVALGERVVAVCREKNFLGQRMLAACALARAYVALGRGREAVALAQEAITLQEAVAAWSDRSWMQFHEALGHLAAGELDEAEADAALAVEVAERHGERGWLAWAHYVVACVARRRGDAAAAEEHLDAAQDLAEELGLALLLGRCRAELRPTGQPRAGDGPAPPTGRSPEQSRQRSD